MSEPGLGLGGLKDSARRILESAMALLSNRVELIGVELREEQHRVVRALIVLAAGLAIGFAGMLVALGGLALFLWTVAGYAGLAALAVVLIATSALILRALQRRILTEPPPFAATVGELRKDRECLRRTLPPS